MPDPVIRKIAGHEFNAAGNCIKPTMHLETPCPIRWHDIRTATKADVGQFGVAHYLRLNDAELEQITSEAAEEDKRISRATALACGTGYADEEKINA